MSLPESTSSKKSDELLQLDSLSLDALEQLRQNTPGLQPASDLTAFLRQGLAQANSQQAKGLFGLLMTLPAVALSMYQRLRGNGDDDNEAFPDGMWQFYTQFGLREDSARHANETEGFHQATPPEASELDKASAWVYQCVNIIFEYETLLENEWVERTLLRLVHESIADATVSRIAMTQVSPTVREKPFAEGNAKIFKAAKQKIRETEVERVELETEQYKKLLGVANLESEWVKRRPYRLSEESRLQEGRAEETYPQYRRRLFLEFLAEVGQRLPNELGSTIWNEYYERSEKALPAYQKQMSILFSLDPTRHQDDKIPIPLWKAKIGFIHHNRYYLITLARHNTKGQLLVFDPNDDTDPGTPLILREQNDGTFIDQHNRQVSINRRGQVKISVNGSEVTKLIRRLEPAEVKAIVAEILHQPPPYRHHPHTTDIYLSLAPRPHYKTLVENLPSKTQQEVKALSTAPIIINWDQRDSRYSLMEIRNTHRGIGNHALTILRTESSFVFDQSHIFFDAIWGMVISQIITDGAVDCYRTMAREGRAPSYLAPHSLRLTSNEVFRQAVQPHLNPNEMTAESETPSLSLINRARKHLSEVNIPMTVNDILTFYRTLHDQNYHPSLMVQQKLVNLRINGYTQLADEIEQDWKNRRAEPVSLLLPMDASFIDPKLRLFPATFTNFLPKYQSLHEKTCALLDEVTYRPSRGSKLAFYEARRQVLTNLLILVEYFAMLKRITREGESLSTAAIRYLAHLPAGMQGTLDLIPQHVGALNEILKGEEVFSNVGRVAPSSSLMRFMSAKDDGRSKVMVWGVMCDSRGNLKVTLRDFRPVIGKLLNMDEERIAHTLTFDYLESYAIGLNQFAEDLGRIASANV